MKLAQTAWIAAAALLAAPCFGGQWFDDFEAGGLDDWNVFNQNPDGNIQDPDGNIWGTWEKEDGVLVGQIFDPDSALTFLQLIPSGANPAEWQNYTVRVSARMDSAPNAAAIPSFGVMLYDSNLDARRRHYVRFYVDRQQILLLTITELMYGYKIVQFEAEQGVWYDMYVSVQTLEDTDRITFRVSDAENDIHTDTVTIDWPLQIGSGGVALVLRDARVSFDNFVLEGDNIPNGGTGDPWAVSPAGMAAQLWGQLKN